MYETTETSKGVGLVVPRIGVDLRLSIFGFEGNLRHPDEQPMSSPRSSTRGSSY